MVYIIFICIVAPLLLMLFLLEKSAKQVVGFMIIGIVICLFAYEVNSVLHSLLKMEDIIFTTAITPISEEILKILPVLFFAFVFSGKKEKVLPVAMAVGIGFAILENTFLLTQSIESVNLFWAVVRGLATGLMHGITTAIVGFGITYAKTKKKLFYTGTFGLLSVAITYHSIYNMLVQSNYSYIGFLLPILTYIPVVILLSKKKKIVKACS